MIRPLFVLTLAAAAAFAACSGPGSNAIPAGSVSNPAVDVWNAPSHGTLSAMRHIYAQLKFDGTNFTEVSHVSCGHRGLGGMTPYTAPTSGPLALAASVSLAPRCVPSPLPSPAHQLYIFAIPLHAHHGKPNATHAHFDGVIVAGPANLGDNPWVFAPASPGLTMVGGAKYDFVVATLWTRPTPNPSSSP